MMNEGVCPARAIVVKLASRLAWAFAWLGCEQRSGLSRGGRLLATKQPRRVRTGWFTHELGTARSVQDASDIAKQ